MKKNIYKIFIIFCILFVLKSIAISAGISVYSSVNKKNIGLGEDTTLKLTIAGVGFFEAPKLPKIPDFLIHQSGQYTGTDFSTGKPISYTVFEYILISNSLGSKTIPSIQIPYKGYYYSTEAIKIEVSETVKAREERLSSFYSKIESAESKLAYKELNWNIDKPVFIISNITSKNLYFNEQLIYSFTLFTRVPILKSPKIVFPEYEAMHQEILSYKKNYYAKIQEHLYQAVEYRTALFPFMTGEQSVPRIGIRFSRDCFEEETDHDLENKFKSKKSFMEYGRTFKVNISPIPLKNKPLNFSGLIGSFDIEAKVNKDTLSMDDYIILVVKIKGTGNLRSIPDVNAPIMDKLSEYDNKRFLNFNKKKGLIVGEKVYKMVLVPRDLGEETIPSISFSYYDIKKKDFVTKWTDPIKITINEKKEDEVLHEVKTEKRPVKYTKFIPIILLPIILLMIYFIKKRNK